MWINARTTGSSTKQKPPCQTLGLSLASMVVSGRDHQRRKIDYMGSGAAVAHAITTQRASGTRRGARGKRRDLLNNFISPDRNWSQVVLYVDGQKEMNDLRGASRVTGVGIHQSGVITDLPASISVSAARKSSMGSRRNAG